MKNKTTKVLVTTLCVVAILPLISSSVFAQSVEISPRMMERMTRNWSRMLSPVVPRNCVADSAWFSGGIFAPGAVKPNMKVVKPDGTTYICKECNSCSGIRCEGASGKTIYVAKHCSGADGEIDF
jgi:hypothetical protein